MTTTTLRRSRPNLYGVGSSTDGFISLERTATEIISRLYSASSGAFVSEIARYTHTFAWWTAPVGIQHDPLGNVGDYSWAWGNGLGHVRSWDVLGGTLYDYTAAAGFDVVGPIYLAGYLYWIERGTGAKPTTMRLRKAACDLSGVTTVGSLAANPAGTSSWTHPPMMALNNTAAITYSRWNSNNFGMRFTLDGASSVFSSGVHLGQSILLPAADGGSVGVGLLDDLTTRGWLHLGDSVGSAPTLQWPQTGTWEFRDNQIDGNGPQSWLSAAWISDDQTQGLACGSDGPSLAGLLPKAATADPLATTGSPTVVYPLSLVDRAVGLGTQFGLMPKVSEP